MERFPKTWKEDRKSWKSEDESKPSIIKNTEKSLGDLKKLFVTQTPMKYHLLTLVGKAHKEYNNDKIFQSLIYLVGNVYYNELYIIYYSEEKVTCIFGMRNLIHITSLFKKIRDIIFNKINLIDIFAKFYGYRNMNTTWIHNENTFQHKEQFWLDSYKLFVHNISCSFIFCKYRAFFFKQQTCCTIYNFPCERHWSDLICSIIYEIKNQFRTKMAYFTIWWPLLTSNDLWS